MRSVDVGRRVLLLWVLTGGIAAAQSQDLKPLLDPLRQVEREGKGHREATRAWSELTARCTADQLPTLLAAIDGTSPLAANWLRAAVDAVAERELRRNGKLPVSSLEEFLQQRQHDQRARRLAYEWIVRSDPAAENRLIPGMLDDPSLELRRDAVAQLLSTAATATTAGDSELALATYQRALDAARDLDQVKVVTEALKKAGRPVDVARHFGFVQDWRLVGPFDNRQGKGFDTAYPPEASVDLAATYPTENGTIGWTATHTDDEYGHVDLNKALGKHKGAAAYAVAEFQSEGPHHVELRLGSENANKVWLNGKLLSSAEVYHSNGTMDQYLGAGDLRPGRNQIVLKICQNEQTEEWAQEWKFQLRVCDALGKAVLATDRPGTRSAQHPSTERSLKE